MSKVYEGGCACGAIRYATDSKPIFENHCQCRDCQKRSGTGHGSYLTFQNRADVRISGTLTEWRLPADSGSDKFHAFCPRCGTPLFQTYTARPELITVPATSLDDPNLFKPRALTYSIHGLQWDMIDPSMQTFERMPG
jgi:hypothetical protein